MLINQFPVEFKQDVCGDYWGGEWGDTLYIDCLEVFMVEDKRLCLYNTIT